MVQVLPGFEAQLGQNIAQIVGAIQNVIDPDFEVKKLIKQKAMLDPSYAQNLANFAFSNPEVFKKLGMGKIGEVIGTISPDLKTVMEEAQKGFVATAKGSNPELEKQAGQKALYGKTEAELRMEKQREIQAGLNIALSRQTETLNTQRIQEGEAELERIQLAQKGIQDALANYEGLKGMNLSQIADDFLTGKADGNVMSQIFSTPQLAKPMQEILQLKQQERSLQNQLRVASYGSSLKRRELAEEMVIRTSTGTPDLWRQYMSDPATQQRLTELVADPKVANTPKDQMLIQMYNAINTKQNATNSRVANQLNMRTVQLMQQAQRPGADLEAIANQMNVMYQQLGEATGNYFAAQVTEEKGKDTVRRFRPDIKGAPKKRIRIIDTVTGEEVEPSRQVVKVSGAPASNAPPQNIINKESKEASKEMQNQFNEEAVSGAMKKLEKADKKTQEASIDASTKLSENDKKELRKRLGLGIKL